MTSIGPRRWLGALVLAVAVSAGLAAAASANTVLLVNAVSGGDVGNCQSSPCKSLGYAVTQGEAVPDLVTIDAAAGTYTGNLNLTTLDSGLTITGVGSGTDPSSSTVVTGVPGSPTFQLASSSSLRLNHLRIVDPSTDAAYGVQSNLGDVTLSDVPIDVQGTGGAVLVSGGRVAITNSPMTLENATGSNAAVLSDGGSTDIENSPITVAGPGNGILATTGSLTVANSPVTLSNSTGNQVGIISTGTQGATITNSAVDDRGTGDGLVVQSGPLTLTNSPVTLDNSADAQAAVISISGPSTTIGGSDITTAGTGGGVVVAAGGASLSNLTVNLSSASNTAHALLLGAGGALSHVTVKGAFTGGALLSVGSLDMSDSTLGSGAGTTNAVATLQDGSTSSPKSGNDVSIVRSTLTQTAAAVPAIAAGNVKVLVDSSEVLGGKGTLYSIGSGVSRTLTIVSSTIDAGALGARDASPVQSLLVTADNTAGTAATVAIEGSILVEPPAATRAGTTGTAKVECASTEVPDTTQAATATLGQINCGAGTNANTSTAGPLSTVFADPSSGYALNPTWSGVDSVPASAISVPAPFSDSDTDLAGATRVLNGVGTCAAGSRDKGALELTGHAGAVPAPAIAAPATVLVGSPATFTASAPNVAASVPLTYAWSTSDGATGAGAGFAHTFAQPGGATVSVTVTGAAGCTGTASQSITVSQPSQPPHLIVVAHRDAITKLTISPKKFRPAKSGASVVTGKAPATISYKGTEAATTTFTVTRVTKGRKQGKTCKARSKKNAKGKACALLVKAGTFTHHDAAGIVKFGFTGRVAGKPLKSGGYRLTAVASDAAGKSKAVTADFTIKS
jgi:PKD domain